jgi:hypothetical protein
MIREPYVSSGLRWLLSFYGDSYQLLTFLNRIIGVFPPSQVLQINIVPALP